ncbi:hydrogenase maturation protease [Desulfuromonas soudanensis]|uniref:Hydrogenase maturation protease n=1 Tax=Desulfuromonas soudanensis TaxID=1603606 RepID=A0A0M3QGI3_9BACT|nr:hydrogenase maturation protease [Desulfuromonas soudanensis]ALC18029.1 hydrogenase maturation protease [Desulfuromonas soudanensis]
MRIIGIGNPLMGDDGIGIAAVAALEKEGVPEGVDIIDGGTGGLTLLTLMEGAKRVILVDAVETGSPPGTILRLAGEDLEPETAASSLSLHSGGLPEVLALGRALGTLPPLILFGVQPHSVEVRLGLSDPVAAALPPLLALIREELKA